MKRALLLAMVWSGAASAQSVQVTGMVQHAGPVSLATLKQVDVSGSFHTMSGAQSHHWAGPLLLDVLNAAGITDAPGKKTHMRHVILASGTDGYTVTVAIGEIDPRGEGKQVIVALQEDGTPLATPRLVVPNDASFTRGVKDLAGIDVK
jgi:hypothetical protein